MGEAEASPKLLTEAGLVALNFADDTGSIQARTTIEIELNRQVAFSQFLRSKIADEGEPVTELELGNGEHVALESRCRCDSMVSATG
jgi:hypothetical protein